MILKTLQPKRKEVMPLSNKHNKDTNKKKKEQAFGFKQLPVQQEPMKIQNDMTMHKDMSAKLSVPEEMNETCKFGEPEPRPQKDIFTNSHKRCSSQANKRCKARW